MRRIAGVGLGALVVADAILVALALRGQPPAAVSSVSDAPASPTATRSASPGPAPSAPALVSLDFAGNAGVRSAGPAACADDTRDATVATTLDGGVSWAPVSAPAAVVLRVKIIGPRNLWAIGADRVGCEPTFFASADGGRSWQRRVGTSGAWHILTTGSKVHAPNGVVDTCATTERAGVITAAGLASAYVVCTGSDRSRLLGTADGGRTWSELATLPAARTVYDVLVAGSPARGLLVGRTVGCDGVQVWRSADGGHDWSSGPCVPVADVTGAAVAGDVAKPVLVVAAGVAVVARRSADGGATWSAG